MSATGMRIVCGCQRGRSALVELYSPHAAAAQPERIGSVVENKAKNRAVNH